MKIKVLAALAALAGAAYLAVWYPLSQYRYSSVQIINNRAGLESVLNEEKPRFGLDMKCILIQEVDYEYAGSHKIGDCYLLTLGGRGKSIGGIDHELGHIALGHLENREPPSEIKSRFRELVVEYYLLFKQALK